MGCLKGIKIVVVLAMVMALCILGAGCAAQGNMVIGSYVNPISGFRYESFRTAAADFWGNDHDVIVTSVTDNYGQDKGYFHNSATSPGLGKTGTTGLIQGAASNPGPFFPLIRPSTTNVSNSNNGNGSGANISNVNQQKMKQSQSQSQGQVATGGAGGQGGAGGSATATITNTGGIGNTNTANGNSNINTGNGIINQQ